MTKPLIVITGASSGIGLETAKSFHAAGYPMLLLGRKTTQLESMNWQNTLIRSLDVSDFEKYKRAIIEAQECFGPIDGLFNIAGQMLLGDIADQNRDEWQAMLEVNIKGVLNGMQAVLSSMRQRRAGTIINVSSIAGIKPFPNHAAYTATKFAVHGLSDNVREEVAPYNVRVITLAPGAVETPLITHTSSDKIKSDYQAWKKDMGGVLSAKTIADIILFAYQQPQAVCMREIVVSSTKQAA